MHLPAEVPEEVKQRLAQYCRDRVPERLRDRIRVACKIHGLHVTLGEQRPPFTGGGEWTDTPVAQLRCRPDDGTWMLY